MLVFKSDVLTEDVTVAGPITANLFVSTTGTDADFIVKLIDVYPDDTADPPRDEDAAPTGDAPLGGFEQMLRWDVLRGRFRVPADRPPRLV